MYTDQDITFWNKILKLSFQWALSSDFYFTV